MKATGRMVAEAYGKGCLGCLIAGPLAAILLVLTFGLGLVFLEWLGQTGTQADMTAGAASLGTTVLTTRRFVKWLGRKMNPDPPAPQG